MWISNPSLVGHVHDNGNDGWYVNIYGSIVPVTHWSSRLPRLLTVNCTEGVE
jgi:hypothetical protein